MTQRHPENNAAGEGLESEPRRMPSVERDDHLVRMRDIQVLAEQFSDQIRVRVSRVEQYDPIAQFIPLRLQSRDLAVPLVEHGQILAPCEHAARTRKSQTAQNDQTGKCHAPREAPTTETVKGILSFHDIRESQLTAAFKRYLSLKGNCEAWRRQNERISPDLHCKTVVERRPIQPASGSRQSRSERVNPLAERCIIPRLSIASHWRRRETFSFPIRPSMHLP